MLAPLGAGLLLGGCSRATTEAPVVLAPTEALGRGHALLGRILMIYDEIATRLEGGAPFPPEALAGAAGVIESYYQATQIAVEETLIFPRLERSPSAAPLLPVLRCQHAAGRRMTAEIGRGARPGALGTQRERLELATALRAYARMMRAHAAREETALFPLLSDLLPRRDLAALAGAIAGRGLGAAELAAAVERVDAVERMLGVESLAGYTAGPCE